MGYYLDKKGNITSLKALMGFTLIEVVVAMLILGAVVAGMLAVFSVGRRAVKLAGHKVEALSFAQETIEDLKGKVGGHLWSNGTPGKTDLDQGDHTLGNVALGILQGTRSYVVTDTGDPNERYKRVTVTVSWTEP